MLSRLRLDVLTFLSDPEVIDGFKQHVAHHCDEFVHSPDPVVDAVSNVVAFGKLPAEDVTFEMFPRYVHDMLVAMAWQNPTFDLDKLATKVVPMLDVSADMHEFVDRTLTWDADAHASLTDVGSTPFFDDREHELLKLVIRLVGYSLTF